MLPRNLACCMLVRRKTLGTSWTLSNMATWLLSKTVYNWMNLLFWLQKMTENGTFSIFYRWVHFFSCLMVFGWKKWCHGSWKTQKWNHVLHWHSNELPQVSADEIVVYFSTFEVYRTNCIYLLLELKWYEMQKYI